MVRGIATTLVVLASLAQAQDYFVTVTAEGTAEGEGLAARDAALANAKHDAVKQVVEAIIASRDLSPVRSIIDDASAYVHSFRLVQHEQTPGASRVEIQANLWYEAIRSKAARLILPRLFEPPKVLVLMAEQMGADGELTASEAGVAEVALVEGFRQMGLDVLEPGNVRSRYSESELMQHIRPDSETGRKLGLANLASVVVLGEAVSVVGGGAPGSNVHPSQATVTVRVIRVSDGQLVDARRAKATVHSVDPRAGGTQAILDACLKLRDDLMTEIVLAVVAAEPSNDVILTIERPGGHGRLEEVGQRLREQVGVEEVEELLFSAGLGRLRVKYSGQMRRFVEVLTEEAYSDFRVDATQVVDRDVRVSIVTE